MDLMKLGSELLMSKLGGNGNGDSVTSMLSGLLSNGGDTNPGGMGGLLDMMKEKGLGSIADSWLGDGDNEEISPDQMREVLGQDQVSQMAQQLDTNEDSLLDGLRDALPQIVDKSSSGGSLLDKVGGLGGAMDMAKKFLG